MKTAAIFFLGVIAGSILTLIVCAGAVAIEFRRKHGPQE